MINFSHNYHPKKFKNKNKNKKLINLIDFFINKTSTTTMAPYACYSTNDPNEEGTEVG